MGVIRVRPSLVLHFEPEVINKKRRNVRHQQLVPALFARPKVRRRRDDGQLRIYPVAWSCQQRPPGRRVIQLVRDDDAGTCLLYRPLDSAT
jgi:hypothetical protein